MGKIMQRWALAHARYAEQSAPGRVPGGGGPSPSPEAVAEQRARIARRLAHLDGPLRRKAERATTAAKRRRFLGALNRVCSGSAQIPDTDPRLA